MEGSPGPTGQHDSPVDSLGLGVLGWGQLQNRDNLTPELDPSPESALLRFNNLVQRNIQTDRPYQVLHTVIHTGLLTT